MQKNQQYAVIALMLLGLLLFHFVQQGLWQWLSHDFHDGGWACQLAARISPQQTSPLTGIEGRFLWTSSTILLLVSIGMLIAASAHSLIQRLPSRRLPVALGLTLTLLALLGLLFANTTPDHQQFMQLSSGPECGFAEQEGFTFMRYLLLLFQPYYRSGTLDYLSYAEVILPPLLLLTNLLLLLGLMATAWPKAPSSRPLEELAIRIARYRLLLLLASALFTAIALFHMSEYAWFAQVVAESDSQDANLMRGLQRGVTLYFGVTNSLALTLFFAPIGWLLWRQALALSSQEALETPQAREAWLAQHGLKLFSGHLMQIGALFAPLLVSGGLTLLQQAFHGG